MEKIPRVHPNLYANYLFTNNHSIHIGKIIKKISIICKEKSVLAYTFMLQHLLHIRQKYVQIQEPIL